MILHSSLVLPLNCNHLDILSRCICWQQTLSMSTFSLILSSGIPKIPPLCTFPLNLSILEGLWHHSRKSSYSSPKELQNRNRTAKLEENLRLLPLFSFFRKISEKIRYSLIYHLKNSTAKLDDWMNQTEIRNCSVCYCKMEWIKLKFGR